MERVLAPATPFEMLIACCGIADGGIVLVASS